MLFKFLWFLRGLLYKPFFAKYALPSYIGRPVFIKNFHRIFINERVRIFPGSRIEVVNKEGSIVFEKNVSIGQNFHIISAGELLIGSGTVIAENVMITNVDHSYYDIDVPVLDQKDKITETKIGPNCFIGYGAVIQAGTILGRQCIVGAGSVVRGRFPDYSVIVGTPAKIVKRYNIETKQWERTTPAGDFLK